MVIDMFKSIAVVTSNAITRMTVILDRSEYINKYLMLLNDTSTYMVLKKM